MDKKIDDVKDEAFVTSLSGFSNLLGGLVFTGFTGTILFNAADDDTRILILPFFICGIAVLIQGISTIRKSQNMRYAVHAAKTGDFSKAEEIEKIDKKTNKSHSFGINLYLFSFFVFWFGLLIFADYQAIMTWNEGGSKIFYSTLIFWAAGIFVLLSRLKKNKK